MKTRRILVLPGDGIGPEVCAEAVKVLVAVRERFGLDLEIDFAPIGGSAYDLAGNPLPPQTVEAAKAADAVLLGAVGGPKWDALPPSLRPEAALLGIRAALGLYCNLRPAVLRPALRDASPLRPEKTADGLDILVVRELTGGIYFGEHGRAPDGKSAWDVMKYSDFEVARIARRAFEAARGRRGDVVSVDKRNVLAASRLWREVVERVHADEFADVALRHLYVDNAAMQLVCNPAQFDVILTSNLFGDILSDEASVLTGSLGMLPSASLGDGGRGLYEPIHGSAPDIAGQGVANPLATILSAALLLRHSLGEDTAARAVEDAVDATLAAGLRTRDIASPGAPSVGTAEAGDAACLALHAAAR